MADGICKIESLQLEIKVLESDLLNNRHGNSCLVIMTFLVLECSYCVDLSMYTKNVILRNWMISYWSGLYKSLMPVMKLV